MHAQPPEVKAVFDRALEIDDPAERLAYLERIGVESPEVRARVEELLRAHEDAGSFLQGVTQDEPLRERPGMVIGSYKLLQQIGEGGMGVVYMAEQETPVRRRVALKIIKPGMDSAQVIARFEAERQALALMDHQNIARVLEAGATDSGRPYFVMELVHGVPITKYCDDNKLTPRQRLELFVPVCQAVQHAHQKGIIHRDLKPSNILVTLYDGKPVPKVIDFGVAKATEQHLTERTLFTQYGTIVGTFEYMAPEQAEMSALGVDTRSDVYSLGVLLYELLTGTTPLERARLRGAALGEMLRLIREEEPPKPSARISTSGQALATISQQRNTEAAKLAKLVRGELDWIVMKALEKDRTRRYETASGLARDVDRYLKDEPVEACPPSAGYRLRKFMPKHKAPLTVAGVFALLLFVGAAVSSWQAFRARRAEKEAIEARKISLMNEETAIEKEALANHERLEATTANNHLRDSQEDLRHTLYYARSSLLQNAWDMNNMSQVFNLLEQQRPKPGERDLRGFEWFYRDRQCHLDLLTIANPDGPTAYLTSAFSPDGRFVACGIGNVIIYDLKTGLERSRLPVDKKMTTYRPFWIPNSQRVCLPGTGVDEKALGYTNLVVLDTVTGNECYRLKLSDISAGDAGQGLYFVAPLFSLDGKTLAVRYRAQKSHGILIADAMSGKPLRTIERQFLDGVMTFSPDGQRLATCERLPNDRTGPKNLVDVWDVSTGEKLFGATEPHGLVDRLTFSPDGSRLGAAILSQGRPSDIVVNRAVQVWDAANGKELFTLPTLSGGDRSLNPKRDFAFSPDSKQLATVMADGEAPAETRIWDLATGKVLEAWRDVAGTHLLRFSPDGKMLATAGGDLLVRVWELGVKRAESSTPPGLVLRGHSSDVDNLFFHPDGTRLCTAGQDGTVKVWDVTAREQPRIFPNQEILVMPIDFHAPAGQFVTIARPARFWKDATLWGLNGNKLNSIRLPPDKKGPAGGSHHVLSPGSKLLASIFDHSTRGVHDGFPPTEYVGGEAELCVSEVETGKLIYSRKEDRVYLGTNREFTTRVNFSKDGTRLAWGLTSVNPWEPGETPDQTRVAGTVTILDAGNGRELLKITSDGGITDFTFHPDGTRVVIAGPDGQLAVWDATTGAKLLTLEHTQGLAVGRNLLFSPDGSRLTAILAKPERPVIAILNRQPEMSEVAIWDAQTGKKLYTLPKSPEGYSSLAFSPDGRRLATAAESKNGYEVKLWDTTTGNELLTLKDLREQIIQYLTFSPDGTRLYAAGKNSGVRARSVQVTIWDATPRPEAKQP